MPRPARWRPRWSTSATRSSSAIAASTSATRPLCPICRDPMRDQTRLCVVEEPLDVLALERTGEFKGLYHVLHGAISPIDGIGPDRLKIRELLARADEAARDGEPFDEVILATNPTLEGEATAMYLAERLEAGRRRRQPDRPRSAGRRRPRVRRRGDPDPGAPGPARRLAPQPMSNLVAEIVLRLAKAGAALVLGDRPLRRPRRAARRGRLARARAPLLAQRRGVHPARGEQPDLTARPRLTPLRGTPTIRARAASLEAASNGPPRLGRPGRRV